MQNSKNYGYSIPELIDGIYKSIEKYRQLFHDIDTLIYENRFRGNEFTNELRSKLHNIQYENLSGLEAAVINLQDQFYQIMSSINILDGNSQSLALELERTKMELETHQQAIQDINTLLSGSSSQDIIGAIQDIVDFINGDAANVLEILHQKANDSDVEDLKRRIVLLESRLTTFDKFGIVTDDVTGNEYYITINNGQIIAKKTDWTILRDVTLALRIVDADKVSSNLMLPIAMMGCIITWQSSDESIVESGGMIHQPEYGEEPATATLTATITKDIYSATLDFPVTILPITAYTRLLADMDTIVLSIYIDSDIDLPATIGVVPLVWTSSDKTYIDDDGTLISRPASYELDKAVSMIATGELGDEVHTRTFNLIVLKE